MVQDGYFADSAALANQTLYATRPDQYVGIEKRPNYVTTTLYNTPYSKGGWWNTPANFGWTPAPAGHMVTEGDDVRAAANNPGLPDNPYMEGTVSGVLTSQGIPAGDVVRIELAGRNGPSYVAGNGTGFCFGGCGTYTLTGRQSYDYNVYLKYYEDYHDYEYYWTGQWHSVSDRRQEYSFQWTTQTEDVFGTVPTFTTYTINAPVVVQFQNTRWRTRGHRPAADGAGQRADRADDRRRAHGGVCQRVAAGGPGGTHRSRPGRPLRRFDAGHRRDQ